MPSIRFGIRRGNPTSYADSAAFAKVPMRFNQEWLEVLIWRSELRIGEHKFGKVNDLGIEPAAFPST